VRACRAAVLAAAFAVVSALPAHAAQTDQPPTRVVTSGADTDDLQAALDRLAADSRCLMALVRTGGAYALLTRPLAHGEPRREYRVVSVSPVRIDEALNAAGRDGFRLDRDVLPFETSSHVTMVLVRDERASARFEFQVVPRMPSRFSLRSPSRQPPSDDVDRLAAEGYAPAAVVWGRVVMMRTAAPAPSAPHPAGAFLVLRDRLERLAPELRNAAVNGYELLAAWVAGDDLLVVLERGAAPRPTRAAIVVVEPADVLAMQRALNAAAADGMRLWRNAATLRDDRIVALVTDASGAPGRATLHAPGYTTAGPLRAGAAEGCCEGAAPAGFVNIYGEKDTYVILESRHAPTAVPASTAPVRAPVSAFDALEGVASLGTQVVLAGPEGRASGRLVRLTDRSLALLEEGRIREFTASSIQRLRERDRMHQGLGIGSIAGLAMAGAFVVWATAEGCDGPTRADCLLAAWTIGPAYVMGVPAVVGAAIGRLLPGRWLLVAQPDAALRSDTGPTMALSFGVVRGPAQRPAAAVVVTLDFRRRVDRWRIR